MRASMASFMPSRGLAGLTRLRLPNGIWDAACQIGLWLLADAGYETVRGLVAGRSGVALTNANELVALERSMGSFFEPSLQAVALRQRWLIDGADFVYVNCHFLLTTAFVIWVYLFRNSAFYFVRNVFLVSMAACLTVEAVLPLAPPRMLAGDGFVDTIHSFAHINQDTGTVSPLINSYAAMPSMHVAFASIVGVTGAALARRTPLRVLWALYPLLITGVVIVTANHFWLDAVAGIMASALAVVMARGPLTWARPEHWSWRLAPREALAAAPSKS